MAPDIAVEITLKDLEDVRQTLAMCQTLLVARDVMESQIAMNTLRTSPLTQEVERLTTRFDAYFADYLLAKHEAENDALDEDEAAQEDEEQLAAAPLGEFQAPRQAGRRLSNEDIRRGLVGQQPAEEPGGDA